jgi:hypothetical protein
MSAALLDRLDGVRQTGAGRWIAKCPGHDDRRASLSIRELDDGRTLLHCFAGCDAEAVLNALQLDYSALFPDKPKGGLYVMNERRPFSAMDVLRCVSFEALIAAVASSNLAHGTALTETDHARLLLAAERLQSAVGVANGC